MSGSITICMDCRENVSVGTEVCPMCGSRNISPGLREVAFSMGILLKQVATSNQPEEKPDRKASCPFCGWKGSTLDCGFGHKDFYCPDCDKEGLDYEF